MTRGETYTVRVERVAAGGSGIARFEGKSIFIQLAAPGDKLRCRIIKDHKNWAEGEIVEILESSAERIIPECSLYGRCGGCSLQHMKYEAQLAAKTEILKEAFIRIGGFKPPDPRLRAGAPFGYRNRMRFHKKSNSPETYQSDSRSRVRLCFKERKSSTLVEIQDCPVAEAGIRKFIREGRFPAVPEERLTVFSHGETFLLEGGTEQGLVSILGRDIAMSAPVFFQSNAAMLELLIKDLIETAALAEKNLPLADIYCGVGTFASFLADDFSGADLVEENNAAISLARQNMPREKTVNYYSQKDSVWVKTIEKIPNKSGWGFMILDPPRSGLSGVLRNYLAAKGAPLIAYVSCDPATLARDSRDLLKGGYELKQLALYDFYPQTAHIESLAIFQREK